MTMKIFKFRKKKREGLQLTDEQMRAIFGNPNIGRKEHTYLVAIFWYDTKNVTNQRVAAYTKEGALIVIKELFKGKEPNKDFGIVNIIEMH